MNGNFGTSKAIQPIKVLIEDLILGHPIDPAWPVIFLTFFLIAYFLGAVVFRKNVGKAKWGAMFKGIAALSFIASMIVGEWPWVGFLVGAFIAWWWGFFRCRKVDTPDPMSIFGMTEEESRKRRKMSLNEYNLEYTLAEIKSLKDAIRDAEEAAHLWKHWLDDAELDKARYERKVAEERGEVPKGKEGVDYEWVEEEIEVEVYRDNGEEVHKDNEKEV